MLLDNAWRGTTGHHCLFTLKSGLPSTHWVDNSPVDIARWQSEDTFLALATFNKRSREAENAIGAKGFWLDIDVGEKKPYTSVKDALESFKQWSNKYGMPKPSDVILSGHGVHIYWFTNELIAKDKWLGIATSLKEKGREIHIDPTRTADIASVMRLPGTINYKKPDDIKRVLQLIDGNVYNLVDLVACFGEMAPVEKRLKENTGDYPEANILDIARSCPTMYHCLASKGAVEEPLWRGMLSVLSKCVKGDILIHEFSKGDPRYNPRETERKAALTPAPYTCSTFRTLSGKCAECKMMNLINSPISLGFPSRVNIETTTVPTMNGAIMQVKSVRVTESSQFIVTKNGICRKGDDAEYITFIPLWVTGVKEGKDAVGGGISSIELEWEVQGRTRKGVIRQSLIYEKQTFVKWLSDHNIIAFVASPEKLAMSIKQFTQELIKKDQVKEQYDTLGWVDESFVLGRLRVDKFGVKEVDLSNGSPLRHLQPIGDLRGWINGLAPLTQERCRIHAFALLAGFGSPLLALAGYQSAIISLAGKTNGGKTLAASLALSIYGNPSSLMLAPSASDTMIEKQLECNKNVPFLLDEVSSAKPERVANLLYMISNGKPKETLTRSREARRAGEWNLMPFFTTNFPVLEMSRSAISEAHRRRVIELYTDNSIADEDSALLVQSAFRNYGNAAAVYMQNICALGKEKIAEALRKIEQDIGFAGEYRFIRWTVSAAMLGGKLAKAMGLLPKNLDVERIIRTSVKDLHEECDQQTDSDNLVIRELIAQSILKHYRNVVAWSAGSLPNLSVNANGTAPIEPFARYDRETDKLYIPAPAYRDMLKEGGMSENVMKKWEKENGVKRQSARIVPGASTVYSVIIDCSQVGLDFKSIDAKETSNG